MKRSRHDRVHRDGSAPKTDPYGQPHRRVPLPRKSRKAVAEEGVRKLVLEVVRRRDGERCYAEGLVDHDCNRWPLDGHEIVPRSAWPKGHLDPDNVRLVCRAAHDWIHDHPEAAVAAGLLRRSWER